jgi:hypothetical protein
MRRRTGERFREAAGAAGADADAAFAAAAGELAAARRQATVYTLYHRPQRSIMEVMGLEEHLEREGLRGVGGGGA